jgi:hypothetical protein
MITGSFGCRRRQPVHHRHLDVQRHQIRPQLLHSVQRMLAVHRSADHLDVGRLVEHARHQAPHQGGVVGDEDGDHGGNRFCGGGAAGDQ